MKNLLPYPDSHIANSLSATGGTLYAPPLSAADLILCRTCARGHSCCEFTRAVALSFSANSVSLEMFTTSAPTVFPFLLSVMISESWGEGLCDTDVPF